MSPCCGKIPDDNDTSHIRDSIENGGPSSSEIASVQDTLAEVQTSQPDLSVSNSKNPFADEIASVKNNHDWWTVKGNHIIAFRDSDGQMNLDIVAGPDRGVHRYYDPLNMREGQTGVENPKDGSRRHDSWDKVPDKDNAKQISEPVENTTVVERDKIPDKDSAKVEWTIELNPPADSVDIKTDEINHVDRITAKYDEKGYLHITKVYTEEVTVNGVTHEKGETHQTLTFPEQNYRVSQDFDPSGKPIPGTAHIVDQRTGKVVWKEK